MIYNSLYLDDIAFFTLWNHNLLYRPTISNSISTWKGRPHPGYSEREGDARASPAEKGKGAGRVQRL